MAVQTLKVRVTEKHIQNAHPHRWRLNPVALALRDAGFRYAMTGDIYGFVSRSSRGISNPYDAVSIALPKKVVNLLASYERLKSSPKKRKALKPVSFVVKLTPDIEKAFSPVQHIERAPNRVFDEEIEIVLTPAA